jgi:phosphatidylinositol glycan class O
MDPKALQVVFNELKKKWDSDSSRKKGDKTIIDPEENKPPTVYGLGTVYSSPVLIIVTCVAMALVVILSDGMVGSVVLLLAQMFLFLEIQASITYAIHKEDGATEEGTN